MKWSALILLAGLAAASPALAQSAETPVMGSSAASGEAAEEAEAQASRILVLGDALGGGLGAGLARVAEAGGDYEVSVRFNEESGLARPEVYDWPATVPKILQSNAYDVIVVMLGSNDRQVIRSGNVRYPFNSPGWVSVYRTQLDLLLDELAASGARIVWAGPPPMKDPEYDAAVVTIAALQRERVEARGFTFIDMREYLSGSGGGFTDIGKDDTGTVTKLRGRDGISFFKAGNNLMGQIVLTALEKAGEAAPQRVAETSSPDQAEKASLVPVFGQSLMNGEAYTVQPEGVTANAVVLAGAGLNPEAALRTLREIAPKGSAAQQLFTRGEAGPAPQGRADDFSAPPAE